MNIPVIINNYNLLTWPKNMVECVKQFEGIGDIIIVDNNSTYEPLLEWYETEPCEIIRCKENLGQYAPWKINLMHERNYEYYVVTDPDLGLEKTPKNCLIKLKEKLDKYIEFDRIGLSLSNINNPIEGTVYYHWLLHIYHEFWDLSKLEDELLKGHIVDTTFALYNINRNHVGKSCSLNFPFSANHLPWEFTNHEIENLSQINPEYFYYLVNAGYPSSFKRTINFDFRLKNNLIK